MVPAIPSITKAGTCLRVPGLWQLRMSLPPLQRTKDKATVVLRHMADDMALDSGIVLLLFRYFDEINSFRATAQKSSVKEYHRFLQQASQ